MLKGHTLDDRLVLAVLAAGLALVFSLDDPRASFPLFLAGALSASAAWLVLLGRPDLGTTATCVAVGAHAIALFLGPAFSDDVFRHIFEGRVAGTMGPLFPFLHPPAEAPALGVPSALLDDAFRRINHADLPTVYPPFAQLVFWTAGAIGDLAGGGYLVVLKLLLAAAGFGAAAFISKAGAPGKKLLLCPLLILEVAREGHADSLAVLGVAAGIYGFATARPRAGHLGFALAALAKLNGLVAFLAALRSTRKGALLGALLASLLFVPFLAQGKSTLAGLSAYVGSWRAGDGLFTLVLAVSEVILGGDWTRIGPVTVTRHQLARAFTALLFVGAAFAVLRRPYPAEKIAERAGLLLLLLLLLSPTLHPWYALWLLPFVFFEGRGRRAMLALIVLAPILHHPAWLERVQGAWTDLFSVRVLVHAPVWLLLFRDRRLG